MRFTLTTLALAAAFTTSQAATIGLMAPLSGPQALVGQDQIDGFMLALEQAGGKLGGQPTTVLKEDDQLKPETGQQIVRKFIDKDKVDAIVGLSFSNVLMGSLPRLAESGTVAIATNAGPSPIAGAQCKPNVFSVAWQNDGAAEAMGKFAQDRGVKRVVLMAPNYQAGKDMLTGFKRYYKGRIVDEVYTKMGQTDYQAELSQLRSKNPKAVFVFYPGGMGIQFLKQYSEAGLRGQYPLYSVYTVDEISIPAVKHAALGQLETRYWSPDLKNPANEKYVADFRKKYNKMPVFYGAQSYDGIMLINSGVKAVKGNLSDKKGMIAAMRKADFPSTRGKFTYNHNHFPIQNFYLLKTVSGPAGQDPVMEIQKTVFTNHKDSYEKECKMKW